MDLTVMKNFLDKSEKVVLLLCLIAIVVCLFLLNNLEIFNFANTGNLARGSLGHIQKTRFEVRQKYKKDFSWQITSQNAALSEGDSLYTGPKSSCEVVLEDGKKILLSENTLLHFSQKNKRLSIDLEFGKIFASGLSAPVVVVDCGEKYKIDPGSAAFELSKSDKCGSLDIDVKSGEIKVDSKKVTTQPRQFRKIRPTSALAKIFELPPNFFVKKEIAVIPPELPLVVPIELKVTEAPPAIVELPLQPPQFAVKTFHEVLSKNSVVKMRWEPVAEAETYIVEIAQDPDFKNFKSTSVTRPRFNFKPTGAGPYYLRAKSKSLAGKESIFSDLAIAKLEFPAIKLNEEKIAAVYKARNSIDQGVKKQFPVSWSEVPSADKYVVEYDDNADFSRAVKLTAREPASVIEVPKTGNYHYRVSAFNKQGRQISSTSTTGEIIYKNIFNMASPRIEASLKSIAYYFQKDFGQFIWLRWSNSVAKVEKLKYRLQISNSNDFKSVNYDLITKENKFLINKNLPQGTYFWRVRAESTEQQSDWSDIGSIKIQTKTNK